MLGARPAVEVEVPFSGRLAIPSTPAKAFVDLAVKLTVTVRTDPLVVIATVGTALVTPFTVLAWALKVLLATVVALDVLCAIIDGVTAARAAASVAALSWACRSAAEV